MEAELKKVLALQLYLEGIVSGFGACRIAGIEKAELQYLLGTRGSMTSMTTSKTWRRWHNGKLSSSLQTRVPQDAGEIVDET